jgi:hypothetical protein
VHRQHRRQRPPHLPAAPAPAADPDPHPQVTTDAAVAATLRHPRRPRGRRLRNRPRTRPPPPPLPRPDHNPCSARADSRRHHHRPPQRMLASRLDAGPSSPHHQSLPASLRQPHKLKITNGIQKLSQNPLSRTEPLLAHTPEVWRRPTWLRTRQVAPHEAARGERAPTAARERARNSGNRRNIPTQRLFATWCTSPPEVVHRSTNCG